MRDQFRLLLALQQVDDRLRALALQEQQLPQRLQAYEAACAAVRQQLVQQQAAIEQSERQQRTLERWQAAQEELTRLRSVTQALQRERALIREKLEEMLVAIERLEGLAPVSRDAQV